MLESNRAFRILLAYLFLVCYNHELFVGHAGWIGSTARDEFVSNTDVVLSVGCRFTDIHTSSFEQGVSFDIPPSKLIHVDIDSEEIGKNYPVEVGIQGDAKVVTEQIYEGPADRMDSVSKEDNEYYEEIRELWTEWEEIIEERWSNDDVPMSISRAVAVSNFESLSHELHGAVRDVYESSVYDAVHHRW